MFVSIDSINLFSNFKTHRKPQLHKMFLSLPPQLTQKMCALWKGCFPAALLLLLALKHPGN